MVTQLDTNSAATSPNHVLRYILRLKGSGAVSHLAEHAGVSRQKIHSQTRETNPVELKARDIPTYARALGVPTDVFFQHHADAVEWFIHHNPEFRRCRR